MLAGRRSLEADPWRDSPQFRAEISQNRRYMRNSVQADRFCDRSRLVDALGGSIRKIRQGVQRQEFPQILRIQWCYNGIDSKFDFHALSSFSVQVGKHGSDVSRERPNILRVGASYERDQLIV